MSQRDRGWRPKVDEERLRDLSRGVSVQSSVEHARAHAVRFPRLGRHVAVLLIPAHVRLEKTGRGPGHYTVWANPDEVLDWVVNVMPVDYDRSAGES